MPGFDRNDAANRLRGFMAAHPAVLVVENDEVLLRLEGPQCGYSLQAEPQRLVLHWWSPERNLVRRVEGLEIRGQKLRLWVRRLGQAQPSPLWLLPAGALPPRSRSRQEFRRRLLGKLRHLWPEWQPQAGDSPSHGDPWQHLHFRRGAAHLLCLALSPEEPAACQEQALAHLLLWVEDWRQQHSRELPPRTRLLLPSPGLRAAALRREGLRPERRPELYQLDEDGNPQPCEPLPLSALASGLARAPALAAPFAPAALDLLARIHSLCPAAQLLHGPRGGASFRLHGLEFARQARGDECASAAFVFGHGRELSPLNSANFALFEDWLRELARQRQPLGSPQSPWFSAQPEAWLQACLLQQLPGLAPAWDLGCLYSQVSLSAAQDSMRLDWLFLHRGGRLGVAELKAGEDPHFALQALDYWLRIRQQHLDGVLERQGYFPGRAISSLPPCLYLIAPALYRHPRLATLLAAFDPEIPVAQWLVNADWRRQVQILERRATKSAAAAAVD